MITAKQKSVISFIQSYWDRKGFSPSFMEIATGTNTKYSSVQSSIRTLALKGYVKFEPGKPRTLRVIKREEL